MPFVCMRLALFLLALLYGVIFFFFERKKDVSIIFIFYSERKKDVLARVAVRHLVCVCDYVNGCTVLGPCRGAAGRMKDSSVALESSRCPLLFALSTRVT